MKKLLLAGSLIVFPMTLMANETPMPGYNHKIPSEIMTLNKVKIRIGDLNFYDAIPDKDTLKKVYDNLDFIRGVDVFLNFIPATSIEVMRMGMKSMGVENYNEIMVMDDLMDSNPFFLPGNTDTVYVSSMIDLEKNSPTVIEIPAGAGPGTINDAFFRFVVDMGAPGSDHNKGGMYLLLPLDYKGDLKPTNNGMKATMKADTRVTIDVVNIIHELDDLT